MFKSKTRPILIPQYEHGRLAGTLASLWGNEQFDRPAVDFPSFVQGVAFHDWAYGVVDNIPILEAAEAEWLAVARQGVETRFDDPSTDIVAKLHLRRLLSWETSPERTALIRQIDEHIAGRLAETGYTLEQFEWADRITRFCDDVAFYFSFEAPVERSYPICARIGSDEETRVTLQLQVGGEMLVDPWPFSVPLISGIVIGYQRAGYPESLSPLVVPFEVRCRQQADA